MSTKSLKIILASAVLATLSHATSFAADCWAQGQQYAAENNGTLTKANLTNKNGKAVCELVVLVPGQDGARPKRLEKTVKAG